MDYEKKYKELVGKIEKAYLYAQTDSTKAVLEDILTELAESEDERIRKTLLGTFSNFDADGTFWTDILRISKDNVLAWLEKQGEQKPVKWSEEDEIGSDATIELLEYFINYAPEFRRPTIRRSIDWLNSLKKRMEEQP